MEMREAESVYSVKKLAIVVVGRSDRSLRPKLGEGAGKHGGARDNTLAVSGYALPSIDNLRTSPALRMKLQIKRLENCKHVLLVKWN
jgi:hypothetical protein